MYANTYMYLVWTFLLLEEVTRDFRESAIKFIFMYLLYVSDCTFECVGRLLWVDISFAIRKWVFVLFKSLCGGVGIYSCMSRDDCMEWFGCSWMNLWMSAPSCCIIVFAIWEISFADVICCGPWHVYIILSHSCTLEWSSVPVCQGVLDLLCHRLLVVFCR